MNSLFAKVVGIFTGIAALVGVQVQGTQASQTGQTSILIKPMSVENITVTTPLFLEKFSQQQVVGNDRMAWHSSHVSHQSHYSHSSHQSHYSHMSGY